MPNGNVTGHAPAYYADLDPTRAEATRGVADRGLYTDPRPPETLATIYDERADMVVGCSDQDTLNRLYEAVEGLEQAPNPDDPDKPVILFDRYTIRRLAQVGGYLTVFQNRTACLLRLAALMDRSLSRFLYEHYRREFFQVVEALVGIRDEIARRTQKPYRTFASSRDNPKLDPRVLELYPLPEYRYWQSLLDLRSGRAAVPPVAELGETHFQVEDKQAWEQAWEEIAQSLAETRVQLQMSARAVGPTPTINRHIENLRRLTYADIERQTRARFPQGWQDISVAQHVNLILYSSVYDVLLDGDGNPMRIPGVANYSLLIPEPGRNLIRHLHAPGLYLSVGRLARYQFAVSGLRAQILPLSGIIGFTRTQSSFTFVHELQEKLQQAIQSRGWQSIAAITVEEAFRSDDLSVRAVRRSMPRLIEVMIRYALDEMQARFRSLYDNYEEILEQSKEILLGVIEDQIKDWATKWLIKKVGKKVIPVLNVISAIQDVLDDEQTELMRAMIACVIMATKSRRPDDMTISAKILARIAVDKTQEAAIRALARRGVKFAAKSAKSALKGKGASADARPAAPDPPAADAPSTPPEAAEPSRPPATADAPPAEPGSSTPPHTPSQGSPPPPPAEARQRPPQQRPPRPQQAKQPAQGDAAAGDRATGAKELDAKGTEPAPEKPAAAPPEQEGEPRPETVQRAKKRRVEPEGDQEESEQEQRSIENKATESQAKGDEDSDARSTDAKDRRARGTTPRFRPRPKEPPLPPPKMPWREKWNFYFRHYDDYPPHIRQRLDRNQQPAEERQKEIDRAIKKHYAHQLSQDWGIPVKDTAPIPMETIGKLPRPRKTTQWQQRLRFFDRRYDDYPRHIQKLIDDPENRTKAGARKIEQAIETSNSRKRQDLSGGDWEKTNIAERTGVRPKLSATSTLKDGTPVQIDDFDPDRRVAREYKASLEVPGDPEVASREIKERMERHAQFAEEREIRAYEWVAHSQDSYDKMIKALAELKGETQSIGDRALREKLVERLKKIHIVLEPILDE